MLLSVIFIILVMAALMAGMATLSGQSSRQLVYEAQVLKARLVAEAALEQKVFELLGNIDHEDPIAPLLVSGCQGTAEVGQVISPTQKSVLATGECASPALTVIRHIEVEVIE
ncbi:hypothetical protein JKV55_07665 [Zobellella sp. CGMCC 1.18722]|uniref:Uncharacterized protein n=2 Tax=Zobellella iuensis TaxID=2803811 RepID=A0ABS1QQR2_9GAMM|nr:hypothetical protein [Zobellella iuensis]